MARNEKQKQKLLRILEILMQRTDDEHGITVEEVISALCEYDIRAERKSIYDDFLTLSEMGFEVEKLPTRPTTYTLTNRIFELAELKLLVDAVQSSRFITAQRSRELISKLSLFAGRSGARALSRSVYVEGRAKTMNRTTLYTIDMIHSALNEGRRVSFKYFDYSASGEKIYHRDGALYDVSPIMLVWNDENYYLVGYDEERGERRHFRVDKMQGVSVTELARSEASERDINPAEYTKRVFGMYGGEEELVTLECDERLAGVIIDRFGLGHTFIKTDFGFRVTLRVAISPNFYAWVLGFGGRMRILSPKKVRDELVKILEDTLKLYGGDGDE